MRNYRVIQFYDFIIQSNVQAQRSKVSIEIHKISQISTKQEAWTQAYFEDPTSSEKLPREGVHEENM